MSALATVVELETHMQIDLDVDAEASAAQALDIASEAIRTEAHQTITEVIADSLTCWVDWRHVLWLPERPVTNVTSITVDGVLVDSSTYAWLGSGEVRFSAAPTASTTSTWLRQAVIVYDHGWATAPDDLKGICLERAAAALTTPPGRSVKSESVGPDSITYDLAAAGQLSAEQRRTIRQYRPPITGVPIVAA